MGQQQRGLGYIRVSKAREEMISPELQQAAIEDWCRRSGIILTDTIIDLDASGRNFARAGIQQVIERIEAREADVVVVWKWSRFGRNVRDCLVNIDRLEAAGGQLRAATEDFDDSPVGKFGRGQFLLMAEFESARIGQQWREAQARRVRQGLPANGRERYGYRYDRGSRSYSIDPETGPVLAEIYARYVAGESVNHICQWLNRESVPTSSKSGAWYQTAIHTMLDSGFGAGLILYEGQHHPGAHEPVIDHEMWEAYQRARRKRRERARRHINPTHPYAGLIFCGACGRAAIRDGKREGAQLRCGQAGPAVGQRCAEPAYITVAAVDRAVAGWLEGLAQEISAAAEIRRQARSGSSRARRDAVRLAREVTRLQEALTRLSRQVAEGIIPVEAYAATRDGLLADIESKGRALAAAQEEQAALAAPLPRLAADLTRDWDRLDDLGKREILAALLRRILIYRRGHEPRVVLEPIWESPV